MRTIGNGWSASVDPKLQSKNAQQQKTELVAIVNADRLPLPPSLRYIPCRSFWRASATPWGWLCESETRRVARRRINSLRADFGEFLQRHVDSCHLADLVANPVHGRAGRHNVDVVAEFLNLVAALDGRCRRGGSYAMAQYRIKSSLWKGLER